MENFGTRLRHKREKAGLTRNALAKKVGVTYNAIHYWEAKGQIPKTDSVQKIAKVLGVSSDYLLNGGEEFSDKSGEYIWTILNEAEGRIRAAIGDVKAEFQLRLEIIT